MGRPIKANKMSNEGLKVGENSRLVGKIGVTAYRPAGGSLVNSTTAYMVAQRGSKQFKLHLEDSSEAVYELKAVAPGSLANTSNQFCVQVILDDSTVAYVEKFYNNTVHCTDTSGNYYSVKYSLGVEGTDMGGGDGLGSKDDKNTGSIDVR